jgi:hypothetical protein
MGDACDVDAQTLVLDALQRLLQFPGSALGGFGTSTPRAITCRCPISIM